MYQLLGRVVAIAANQHGLVTRQQLDGLGVERHHLHRWRQAGLVRRAAERVFAVAGSPQTAHQQALAAVWSHGADALLARFAAVDLWFPGRQRADLPAVLVPFHSARSPDLGRRTRPGD